MADASADDIRALRHEYAAGGLVEADLAPDPVTMFGRWFAEARDSGIHEPNAMVVATVAPSGQPSSRFVLLKGYDDDGFRFFTNTASRKGEDLAAEPRCALLFPWHPLERQVRVEGVATPLPPADVAAYFAVRPRGSQLGAWASHQSRVVTGREELAASYDEVEARFADVPDDAVPVPQEWGGYLVRPEVVEFWQGRPGRMHDRLVYRRSSAPDSGAGVGADVWTTERLAP
ncbi:pyridoxamine 5'-phosphate oxidase [Nocardioides sp. 1609]|uniref:pyridoxamine 5'-phosphate oxidase n=1 Tax=Nocardioides sp. 1609 TaxID=2508327 RepID=UPI00106FC912|nr:pyridoxamine 5'-phosphate oxidase [Nocardioides sp. 1609]